MLPDALPRLVEAPICLREFETADAPLIQSAAADAYIPMVTSVPPSGSHDDAMAFIRRQHDRLAKGDGYSFAIAELRTGRAVGQIGLWTREIDDGRTSIGYWIAPDFRRRGYATTALAALTRWAFTLPRVHRVQLCVEPWNVGSRRAAEECGFEREGLLRSWMPLGDGRADVILYSRTR